MRRNPAAKTVFGMVVARMSPYAAGLAALALAPAGAQARPHIAEFGMPLPGTAHAAGAGGRTTSGVLEPGRRFDLVGARWRGRAELGDARVRVRAGGRWRPWVPLADAADHGPDGAGPTHGTDPVWAGGADALQLSWRGALPRHLRLRFVRVTHRPRVHPRARAAQAGGPPSMVMRSQWDPANQCRPRAAPEYGTVQMALVHHTVSDNDYGPQDSAAIVLAICRYHRNSNGWNDIGYNFLVDKYGQLFEGRAGGIDQPVVGAQAQGWNDQSTSVANIGTYSTVPETDAAMQAMANLLAWKLPLHGVPVIGTVTLRSGGGSLNRYPAGRLVTFQRISGHRDGGKTECPGDALYAQLPQLRQMTAAIAPAPGSVAPPASVSLSAAATTLSYPAPAQLSGTLTGPGRISVQVQSGSRFVTVARAQPGPDGSWSATVPLSRAHVVRAVQVLPDGRRGASSEALSLAVQPAVSAHATRRILAGHSVTLKGAIGPHRRVLTYSLALERGGRAAHLVRRTVVARRGSFRVHVRLSRPGLYRLRVRFAGDSATLPAAAPDVFVRAVRHHSSLRRGGGGPAGDGVSGGAGAPAG